MRLKRRLRLLHIYGAKADQSYLYWVHGESHSDTGSASAAMNRLARSGEYVELIVRDSDTGQPVYAWQEPSCVLG